MSGWRWIVVAMGLAACQPEDVMAPVDDLCGAAALQALIGSAAGDHGFPDGTRIIPPGTAVTMDHRPGRLNVETDGGGVITRIYCG